ncbi:MAG: cell wall-binding repeat-containing protein, partial [Peptococcaceae bacterium]|nr:cell wall-binding repeat-containing protein [Peptococcaceae bacterium]
MRQIKKRRLCLMLSMLLILWPAIPAFASADAYQPTLGTTTLLAGADRYATAAAIAREGWNQSAYAILVSGENYPDALVAAPLAGKYDAPIILSLQAQLPEVSQQTLLDLQVQKVFLVGGSGVLSDELMSELQAIGIATQRLAGSALAAHRQAAICLIGNDSVSNATFTYLANKPSSTRQSFILGGQAIYSSTAWSTIQGDLAYSREAIAEAILESSRGGSTISAPPSSASDPLTRLGNNRDKYSLIFGSVDSPKYESAAEAAAHMVTIPV